MGNKTSKDSVNRGEIPPILSIFARLGLRLGVEWPVLCLKCYQYLAEPCKYIYLGLGRPHGQ
jgi:hypothetical protein